jgi:hypothetical protein
MFYSFVGSSNSDTVFAGFEKSSRFMLLYAKQDFVSQVRTLKIRQVSGSDTYRHKS